MYLSLPTLFDYFILIIYYIDVFSDISTLTVFTLPLKCPLILVMLPKSLCIYHLFFYTV